MRNGGRCPVAVFDWSERSQACFFPTSQQNPMRRESFKMSQLSQSHNHVTLLRPSQVFQRQDLTESDAQRAKHLLRLGGFISCNAFIFRFKLFFCRFLQYNSAFNSTWNDHIGLMRFTETVKWDRELKHQIWRWGITANQQSWNNSIISSIAENR